ncbi:hypothetical protein OKW30_001186 [Paraburkholderia sp. Clong3]|uniref:hypothetical protein n=1 Tax=Paraburkholderia sp. Clong3 TaxID=2991061 RepID=UPI003D20D530
MSDIDILINTLQCAAEQLTGLAVLADRDRHNPAMAANWARRIKIKRAVCD